MAGRISIVRRAKESLRSVLLEAYKKILNYLSNMSGGESLGSETNGQIDGRNIQ